MMNGQGFLHMEAPRKWLWVVFSFLFFFLIWFVLRRKDREIITKIRNSWGGWRFHGETSPMRFQHRAKPALCCWHCPGAGIQHPSSSHRWLEKDRVLMSIQGLGTGFYHQGLPEAGCKPHSVVGMSVFARLWIFIGASTRKLLTSLSLGFCTLLLYQLRCGFVASEKSLKLYFRL